MCKKECKSICCKKCSEGLDCPAVCEYIDECDRADGLCEE